MAVPSASARTLSGTYAIVTGATQGLGEAIARELAARGAAGILITGRNAERGTKVAKALSSADCRVEFIAADLADLAAVQQIVPAAEKAFGRIDILVNAAGDTDRGTVFDTSPATYERIMNVNVRAPFFLIQATAELMRRKTD